MNFVNRGVVDSNAKEEYSKATVRAVKVLKGEPRAEAERQNLNLDDIVVVKKSEYNSEPNYNVKKITGSIVKYLKNNGLEVD